MTLHQLAYTAVPSFWTRDDMSTARDLRTSVLASARDDLECRYEQFPDAELGENAENKKLFREPAAVSSFQLSTRKLSAHVKPIARTTIPDSTNTIALLEDLLTAHFAKSVTITSIVEKKGTRKQVKEVHYRLNNHLSKVWLVKSTSPEETARQLLAYHIISALGVPTAKPLGYTPSTTPYPYDVALLGGCLEHAGEPYEMLLKDLALSPESTFETAKTLGRIIANYQAVLSENRNAFDGNMPIIRRFPHDELIQRLYPVRGVQEELASLCDELAGWQEQMLLVSHGDMHNRNILCMNDGHHVLLDNFGIIDWEVYEQHPLADAIGFWVHHRRDAKAINPEYAYTLTDFVDVYTGALKERGIVLRQPRKDALIQSALWNIYELYDSTRTDAVLAEEKTDYHRKELAHDLDALKKNYPGLASLASSIESCIADL
ncbi:MAG: phosphotransferase [archaeon]